MTDSDDDLMRERIETAVRRAESARAETKALVRDITKIQKAFLNERPALQARLKTAETDLLLARAEFVTLDAEAIWLRGRNEATNRFLKAFGDAGGCGRSECRSNDQKPGEGTCEICEAFRAVRDFKISEKDR